MRSIAIVNQKGGCGKTVTAINLASSLADEGRRVMLVDCDPQSHASMGLGIPTDELGKSMYDVFLDPSILLQDVLHQVTDRLHVAPSNVVLSAVEQELAGQPDRENKLRWKLEAAESDFDYTLIDCPPSVGLLTFNSIVACSEAIVVMEPSYFALDGAIKVLDTIGLVREQLGMSKRVRILITMFDRRTRFSRDFLHEAKLRFGRDLFNSVIRTTVKFRESTNWGVPISHYSRTSGGARDYKDLAREVIADEGRLMEDFEPVTEVVDAGLTPGMDEWITDEPGPHFVDDGVLFSLVAPEANDVRLVGDFNNWDTEHGITLNRHNGGLWHTTINLQPGRHLYKFVIDGVWRPDPANSERVPPNDDCVVEVYQQNTEG